MKEKRFTAVNIKNNQKIILDDKPSRLCASFLFYITPFIKGNIGIIVDEDGIPMKINKLVELTGFGRTTVYKVIRELKAKKLLREIYDNNQTYFCISNKYFISDDADVFYQ